MHTNDTSRAALRASVAIATPRDVADSSSSDSSNQIPQANAFSGDGAITPSTVSGMMMTAPQWSQLMPETTDVQEKKRISTSSTGSSSSSSEDDDDEDESVTPWQSASDLPERRVMVQRIITITEKKHSGSSPTFAPQQSAATLAKRIELSLYSRASSLEEYRNVSTLRRRLQSLVTLSCHEAAATRSLEQLTLSPSKRRFPSRTLGWTESTSPDFAIKRRRLAGLASTQRTCSGRIFPGVGDDCLRTIFAFLDGTDVLASRTLNRFAATFLPSCVVRLELRVSQLQRCLASDALHLRRLTNLESLIVSAPVQSNSSSSSTSANTPSTADLAVRVASPLHAWSCTELDASQSNVGEEVVQELVIALANGAGRRLKQLHLVSIFSNTSQRNALRALCDALSRSACPQLEDLLLGGNSVMDAGSSDVARLLKSNAIPELVRLDLRRNYIGEAGLQRIVAALALGAASKLRFLCMGGNIITDTCVAPLTALLAGSACPQLRFLGLEDNFLSPGGVETIIAAATASGMAPRLQRVSHE